ncbi:MAG: hypothetical protein HXY30_03875 [Pseudorhodoplanes sp.]|nr:hypothetical protein [Pseudorhodoplanes sp.]
MERPADKRQEEQRAALAELERLRHEGETLTGAMAGAARRTVAHVAGHEGDTTDGIEIWGRRIGRALGVLAVIGLALHLYLTYMR